MADDSRMPVLVREPYPDEVRALLERRGVPGRDTFDEVWDRVLHIVSPRPARSAVIDLSSADLPGVLGWS